jgi:aconitate hydratase
MWSVVMLSPIFSSTSPPTSGSIGAPIEPDVGGEVLLKMGDNITTDHIIPGTAEVLMYRSNIEKLSEFTLSRVDDSFAERAMTAGGGVLVAGENYGQGSSREHAAMCPLYLGVEAVVAQSFARIHKANLINFGIIPLEIDAETYDQIEQGESLRVDDDAREAVLGGATSVTIAGEGWEATAELDISAREREILAAGGKLRLTRDQFDTGAGGAAPADD